MYLAICSDRHVDPEYYLFVKLDSANKFVRDFMYDNMAHPENINPVMVQKGVCHRYEYIESDYAEVTPIYLEDSEQLQ